VKTTIDIPDELYRRVKAKSALEGRPVREVVVQLVRAWVDQGPAMDRVRIEPARPPWFGALHRYAEKAHGRHDMESIRASIARGRARRRSEDVDGEG
jgi:hypothetical protein